MDDLLLLACHCETSVHALPFLLRQKALPSLTGTALMVENLIFWLLNFGGDCHVGAAECGNGVTVANLPAA